MSTFLRRQALWAYEQATKRRVLTRLNQLERNQWLSRGELLSLQKNKLYDMLEYAYQNVPYYRRLFDQSNFQPEQIKRDLNHIRKLPILTKQLIRDNANDLITTDPERKEGLRPVSTSGSTGQPLSFYLDGNFRDYFTAYVHHHLSWGGWRLGQPHAYIGGASFETGGKKSVRNRLMDWTWNQFSTNAYALSDESLQAFAEQIRQRKPVLLYGYASSIYHLARFVRQNNVDGIKFKSVFSSAEVLYPDQRALIEETFETKVFDRYATRELGEIGSQDETQTGLRLSVENVFVEILNDDGQPAPPGQPGQVVVTNLTNFGMPFIRYNLADVAAWHPENDKVVPGRRAHPMLSIVEGRNNDMFRTRDGRIVWGGITNPLWNVAGVKQFQYIQKSYDLVVVKVVVDGSLPRSVQANVERAIHTALGPQVSVQFEFPAEIPMEKSGKHRYQICEIDPAPSPTHPEREPSL